MAITTIYNGIEYRSRLEARWAAFMQNIGWDIVYEPFDGDGYIPDFLVQGDRPFLVEVKPAVTPAEYEAPIDKAERGLEKHWRHDILIVGAAPISETVGALPRVGLIGEYAPWFLREHGAAHVPRESWEDNRREGFTESPAWYWGKADWLWCIDCRQTGVRSDDYSWHVRPCGCDQKRSLFATEQTLMKAWGDACNDVKWRGSAA